MFSLTTISQERKMFYSIITLAKKELILIIFGTTVKLS